ncbi:MAG: PDDEXK nuclease domain-containing protein [Desulfobacula sp.]|nr:PDDEXK nuclease domain-containing protein [Desulfobacula sp.]
MPKDISYANLRNFRQFYRTYPDKKICDTVCSKLSWSHNRLIMRIDNDLKTDQLTHQDIEQMDIYVRMFDEFKRGDDDNPTVGLILCTSRDETIVKFSVLKESNQLFASKYRLVLPTEAELIAEIERERQLLEDGEVG